MAGISCPPYLSNTCLIVNRGFMNTETLLIYSVVSFFYVITPGPAILLAVSNGISFGLRAVIMSSLGNIFGLLVISVVSIMGLGAIMATSSNLFTLAKFAGAAYLVYLGMRQIMIRPEQLEKAPVTFSRSKHHASAHFFEGFILAVSNPKAILFFTALFPQFLEFSAPMLPQYVVMTGLFMTISFGSLFSWGFISNTAKQQLGSEKGIKWFRRVSGSLFIGVGIGLTQFKHT